MSDENSEAQGYGQEEAREPSPDLKRLDRLVGTWTVTPDQALEFKIKASSTDLLNYSSIAMHWGQTCQNDVIEGEVNVVPTPGALSLMALGLVALGATRRRVKSS